MKHHGPARTFHAVATIGLFKRMPPIDPQNRASPKANTPPSDAANRRFTTMAVDAYKLTADAALSSRLLSHPPGRKRP
jgi:hypothetical protein